jgi:glycosylphosphatidylinositol deacylase
VKLLLIKEELKLHSVQVRSIAAESDRAYIGGPLDVQYYQQSAFTPLEAGSLQDDLQFSELLAKVRVEGQYANHLDWFAVDLEGEHSAMDGWILEEHSEYVVQAVHRVYGSSLSQRKHCWSSLAADYQIKEV